MPVPQIHHEADRAIARATTTREPMLGARAARVVERARERDAIAERHFDLTFQVGWIDMLLASIAPSYMTSIPFSSSVLPISSIFS